MKRGTGKAGKIREHKFSARFRREKLIIPTIFAHNRREFRERFSKLIPIADSFQIDFMDGKFVPGKSVKISSVPNLRKYPDKKFEAHLMTFNPDRKIKKLRRKGFMKVIFHYESVRGREEAVIRKTKNEGLKCFIAINPETPAAKISPFLGKADGILLMGVHPGREHQDFIPRVYEKIREIKKEFPLAVVQIDGGVNLSTLKKLRAAGADILNTGSFVSSSKNPAQALKKLEKEFL